MRGRSQPGVITRDQRVRLSGRLDTLTTRKDVGGFTLFGSLQLNSPYRGMARLPLRLPIGSSLLAGDDAELEGVLLPLEPEGWMLDCSRA